MGKHTQSHRGTDLSGRLLDLRESVVNSLGSTMFHLESVSDSQSEEKKQNQTII